MSNTALPISIDLSKLVEGTHRFSGSVDMTKMSRLKERAECDNQATVDLELTVGRQSHQPTVTLRGQLGGDVKMICERCLQSMPVHIESDFELTVVGSLQAADELAAEETPVIADRDQLAVSALVEDELMLALPIVALHEETNCPGLGWKTDFEKPHPMAVLSQLKREQDK